MKKNTIFPNLIQKLISTEELECIEEAIGYRDTARKLDVMTLVKYFVTASACEWKSFRHCADVGKSAGLPKVDYSTLSKKASHLNYDLMKRLFNLIVSKCNRVTRRALKIPNKLLIIDSTTITVGETRPSTMVNVQV